MRGTGKENYKSQTQAHEGFFFVCVCVSLSAEKVERWAEE